MASAHPAYLISPLLSGFNKLVRREEVNGRVVKGVGWRLWVSEGGNYSI